MSQAEGARNRLRDLLDRVTAVATGRGQSNDLVSAMLREAERNLVETSAGPTIPNRFTIAAADVPEPAARSILERNLAEQVTEAVVHRGRRFDGPIEVTLSPGGRKTEVAASFEPGPLPAWAMLTSAEDDESVTIHHNRAVLGRSKDGDVVINRNGVSRRHALVWRESDRFWIADLQSANGTLVNGDPVFEVVEVRRSDVILFGGAAYTFGTI